MMDEATINKPGGTRYVHGYAFVRARLEFQEAAGAGQVGRPVRQRPDGGREIARVAFIDEDEGTVYLEFEPHKGWFVTLQEGDVSGFDVGSIVFLDWEGYEIELAPEELWPEPTWFGGVEVKGPQKTVVKRDGKSVAIPTL